MFTWDLDESGREQSEREKEDTEVYERLLIIGGDEGLEAFTGNV